MMFINFYVQKMYFNLLEFIVLYIDLSFDEKNIFFNKDLNFITYSYCMFSKNQSYKGFKLTEICYFRKYIFCPQNVMPDLTRHRIFYCLYA